MNVLRRSASSKSPCIRCNRAGSDIQNKAAKRQAGAVAAGADPVVEARKARELDQARKQQQRRDEAAILGVFIDGAYKDHAETHLKSHRETLTALRTDFAKWWMRRMDELSVIELERWRRDEIKRGLAKSTVNRAWERLRAVLWKAVEWKLIDGPPPRIRRYRLDSRGRVRYLSSGERARLLEALERRERKRREERERMREWQRRRGHEELPSHGTFTDHVKPFVLLLLNSGLRRGEALRLRWESIDFVRGMVCVQAATSKSGQSRDVPMSAEARAILESWKQQRADAKAADFLFALPSGERIKSLSSATWNYLCESAKLENFRVHDCRHDFASRLAMAGVDLLSIAKLLGHSNSKMTERYAHLAPDHLRNAIQKLDAA